MMLLTVAGATTIAILLWIGIVAAVKPGRPPARNQSTLDPGALEQVTRTRLYGTQTDNVTTIKQSANRKTTSAPVRTECRSVDTANLSPAGGVAPGAAVSRNVSEP
jgi:hypothetical protein